MESKKIVPFLQWDDFTMENVDDVISLICYFAANGNNDLYLSLDDYHKSNLRWIVEMLTFSKLK